MEETHLLKERLQAITDKRKIQEKITRQRFEVDEEKLKLKHLKSKSLRERWLLEGVTTIYPQEEEAMKKQYQEDQLQSKKLEQNILRLEEEIKSLENQEAQVSLNEQMLLKKLKAAERSTADIIKAAQAENYEDQVKFVHSEIPDLPKSSESQDQQRTPSPDIETQDLEEPKGALFAVEINVQKDMKTGESTILSTAPVLVDEIENKGVKVYEDGVKSVYALCSDGGLVQNGVDSMTRDEVEALLQQAGEKQANVSAVCHAPVYSSSHIKLQSHKMLPTEQRGSESIVQNNTTIIERVERHNPVRAQTYGSNNPVVYQERDLPVFPQPSFIPAPFSPVTSYRSLNSTQSQSQQHIESQLTENELNSVQVECHQPRDNHREAVFITSELDHDGGSSSASEETVVSLNVAHSLPSTINAEEPVTMVFMGYHNVDDENETKKVLGYEGAIRAELVMISDDEDTEVSPQQANDQTIPVLHPAPHSTTVEEHKTYAGINLNTGGSSFPKKPALTSSQDTTTNHSPYISYSDGHMDGVGNYDDDSVSALRSKMTRLGKKVAM
ncbi:paralemmin-2 isoform X1 [Rhincodon typus]|uniref:paralemmin-2 isoform X1 n=1 Tax=Rhincodon typus TaxID=259920 RepID=UPI002030E441|nr:paralemmin-2 isoform X1 [Rhincodon typus]XP_048458134.1 paralemmin-2 isoform X1 [Rhincodon typus]XP_048458135.1 paralemmin-2 isoform X1 [Rhincodon typus]